MTLNIVRLCRIYPRISAYTALEGEFNYNNIPLALLESRIIVGNSPSTQASQIPHRTKVWYIDLAIDHYRCVEVYNPKINRTMITDTFKQSDTNLFKKLKISFEE